jgi:hypothetical protein
MVRSSSEFCLPLGQGPLTTKSIFKKRDNAQVCARNSAVVNRWHLPAGYPFYLRDYLRAQCAPMKEVRRYVPPVVLEW